MSGKTSLTLNKPELFLPSITRKYVNGAYTTITNFQTVSDTNIESTASFRYDPPGTGIRSTQQIPLDWSKFENHTFFNSAEVNVNIAFDRIVNGFPFDGNKKEAETFFDSLTGFEKYVFDQFPKNKGFLLFSGTQVGEISAAGTNIVVNDYAGGKFPTLSKLRTGENIIDPGFKSISFEFQLYLPSITNDNQAILQKISGTNGIGLFLSRSLNTQSCDLLFLISSGTTTVQASTPLKKGKFNHICAVFNRTPGLNNLNLYVNEELQTSSTASAEIGSIDFKNSPLTIGSGSTQLTTSSLIFKPFQTLSGALDELRIFHDVRTITQQKNFANKSIFTDASLVLYYKFNEPTGTLGSSTTDAINRIVLDSSGNSLHSEITSASFQFSLRSTGSISCPMINEKLSLSPILFPNYHEVIDLNTNLLFTASDYDSQNPNLITKLIPKHYFLEGQFFEGLSSEDGSIGSDYTGTDFPGTGKLGSSQILASLLFVYAKFFDELKVVIDSFSKILSVKYDTQNTVPDSFLPLVAEYYGFKFPGLFSDASIEQFIEAENIDLDIGTSTLPLREVQNQLLRRILVNLREIISSKGTLNSIKSFIRSIGIDPDNSFRIKEFGGPTRSNLTSLREKRTEISTLLNFSSSNCFITSSFLSGTRSEVGFPEAKGSFVNQSILFPHGVSNNRHDGLFTSGSWTYEAFYKFPIENTLTSITQSLVRMCVTGTLSSSLNGGVIANIIAISSSNNPVVRLYARPGFASTIADSPLLMMELTGTNIFDGNKWHISFGRSRSDEFGSTITSSYFLRCERRIPGMERNLFLTQSYFVESSAVVSNSLQTLGSFSNSFNIDDNVSGTFLYIGSQSLQTGTSTNYLHLNNTSLIPNNESRHVIFEGKIGHIRFWSKKLTEEEVEEHATNFESLGVKDPTQNFNFVKSRSGSFERLRFDVSTDQVITSSNTNGQIELIDFSKNNSGFYGQGFEVNKGIINVEFFDTEHLATSIDELSTNNKIRVRSYNKPEKFVDEPYAVVAPFYEVPRSEEPFDDTRFSIDFSVVDALNKDIIKIFSSLEFFNVLGKPEYLFSDDYLELEDLRENVYFNRFETGQKLRLQSYSDFFKWISTSIGEFIEQLLPKNTRFKGMNYVIENHLLERGKVNYSAQADILLGEQIRLSEHTILIQQISGENKKY